MTSLQIDIYYIKKEKFQTFETKNRRSGEMTF